MLFRSGSSRTNETMNCFNGIWGRRVALAAVIGSSSRLFLPFCFSAFARALSSASLFCERLGKRLAGRSGRFFQPLYIQIVNRCAGCLVRFVEAVDVRQRHPLTELSELREPGS